MPIVKTNGSIKKWNDLLFTKSQIDVAFPAGSMLIRRRGQSLSTLKEKKHLLKNEIYCHTMLKDDWMVQLLMMYQ
jgi:hypothetical protein